MADARLLPPDPAVSGHHIIGQESSWKGTRLVNAEWDAAKNLWQTMGFRYGARQLHESGWIYVEPGQLDEDLV